MPIVKRTTSAMGNSIVNSIQSFISTNAKAMENDGDQMDVDKAAEALAHAIAYGVAKGFGSASVQAAFNAGICPPSGGPVGTIMYNVLKPQVIEM